MCWPPRLKPVIRQGSLAELVGAGRFDQVFTPEQRQFVRDCAHIGVDVNQLVGLGPIASTKWEDLQIGGVDRRER